MTHQRMEIIYKESGRSARIEKRFFARVIRIELSPSALTFYSTILGVKCSQLVSLPVEQITSVRRVLERGVPSFEINTQTQEKLCWFDSTSPDEWQTAFSSAGIPVQHAPDPIPEKVSSDL